MKSFARISLYCKLLPGIPGLRLVMFAFTGSRSSLSGHIPVSGQFQFRALSELHGVRLRELRLYFIYNQKLITDSVLYFIVPYKTRTYLTC